MSYSEFTKLHTSNKCTHNDSDGTELKLASHFEQVRKFAKQFSEADFAELRKKATELSTKGLDAWEPPVAGRKPWRRYSRQPRRPLSQRMSITLAYARGRADSPRARGIRRKHRENQ